MEARSQEKTLDRCWARAVVMGEHAQRGQNSGSTGKRLTDGWLTALSPNVSSDPFFSSSVIPSDIQSWVIKSPHDRNT